MTIQSTSEVYLGDGLYASFDGFQYRLARRASSAESGCLVWTPYRVSSTGKSFPLKVTMASACNEWRRPVRGDRPDQAG